MNEKSFSNRNALDQPLIAFKSLTYLSSIDVLRGFAAMAVVLYHFVLGNPDRFSDFPIFQIFASTGHLGVQIFFVISGFVIPYSMYNTGYTVSRCGTFIVKRLVRLEPPYLISIIVCVAVSYLSVFYNPFYRGDYPDYTGGQLLSHIGYLTSFLGYEWINVVYWTLAIEFQFYLLIAASFTWLTSDFRNIYIGMLICFGFGFFLPEKHFIFIHSPFFFAGIILFLWKTGRMPPLATIFAIAISVAVVILKQDIIHACVLIFALLGIVLIRTENRFLLFFGAISYSLYLLHVPIGQRIMNFMEVFVTNQTLLLVGLIVAIAVVALLSWTFTVIIENPSHSASRNIKYKV